MRSNGTKKMSGKVANAKNVLTEKYKKKVHQKGEWCLRFHHRGLYFDFFPTTGRWVRTRSERGRMYGARYWKVNSVGELMDDIDNYLDWIDEKRRDGTLRPNPAMRPAPGVCDFDPADEGA